MLCEPFRGSQSDGLEHGRSGPRGICKGFGGAVFGLYVNYNDFEHSAAYAQVIKPYTLKSEGLGKSGFPGIRIPGKSGLPGNPKSVCHFLKIRHGHPSLTPPGKKRKGKEFEK